VNWSQGHAVPSDIAVIVPSTVDIGSSTDRLVQAMSQFSLKEGEIKSLKGDIEKMQQ
jgi:hypothetical protein